MSKISRAVYLALGAAVVASPALAQDQQLQNPPDGGAAVVVLEAEPVLPEMDISLDGRVDEASWGRAVPITDFTQQEPVEGGVPSQRTEVRVLFDEDNIYISAILYDDPEGILAYQMQRDAPLMTDDRFMWILDTFNDGRTGYFFEINPNGLMGDGLITGSGGGGGGRGGGGGGWGGGGMNKAWDGIWEARTFRRPDGWSAEIRIPFRTLNFDQDADHWGINFQRTIRRNNEEILWRGWRRIEGLFKPIFAGDVVGIRKDEIQRGYGLELRGSAIGSWRNQPGTVEPTTFPRDISLDIDYNITPSLRASASINTDFAEVESDERRVNLTRFPQRFRERRAFFLEGSGVFSFAPRSGPQPFFSRRIGLNAGQEIPIEYGTRMTGQAGAYEIGFYQIGTGQHDYTDSQGIVQDFTREQFSVARIKRRIFEQSTIGAIYTRRATSAGIPLQGESAVAPNDQHTAGVDLAFNTRNFLGNKNLQLEAFYVWNSNPDPTVVRTTTDLSAHGFRLNLPNDIWSGHISYRQFGDDYKPAVGFVARNDFRRVGAAHRVVPPAVVHRLDPEPRLLRAVPAPGRARHRNRGRAGVGFEPAGRPLRERRRIQCQRQAHLRVPGLRLPDRGRGRHPSGRLHQLGVFPTRQHRRQTTGVPLRIRDHRGLLGRGPDPLRGTDLVPSQPGHQHLDQHRVQRRAPADRRLHHQPV